METIYEIDTIKIEKEKAMRRYRNFRKIANIVRIVEVMIAIMLIPILISWTSSCIPTVYAFSGVIFSRLSSIVFCPLFVFVIGNVIVITLFMNSPPSSAVNSGENSPRNDDVSVEVEVRKVFDAPATEIAAVVTEEVAVVETEDVSAVVTEEVAAVVTEEVSAVEAEKIAEVDTAVEREVTEKVYRRSQSETIIDFVEKPEFRRSATVPRRKVGRDEVTVTETESKAKAKSDEEEELSNEEFNRRVEEFIAKQRKFISEESKILVSISSNY